MSNQLDPRGPRFVAAATSVVLATTLLVAPSATALTLLAWQAAVFAVGVLVGPAATPYAWLFRVLVRPRLGAPSALEDEGPVRFAQGLGLGFVAVALIGFLLGADLLGLVATGLALAAAFLNATVGLCLGCELHLLIHRFTTTHKTRAGSLPVATKG